MSFWGIFWAISGLAWFLLLGNYVLMESLLPEASANARAPFFVDGRAAGRAKTDTREIRHGLVETSRWGDGWKERGRWIESERDGRGDRAVACLSVVEKSGREANIETTEWAAVWFHFTLFISSPPPVTASSAILFQVRCNPMPAKHSHPLH